MTPSLLFAFLVLAHAAPVPAAPEPVVEKVALRVPAVVLQDQDGRDVDLREFLAEGPVAVNFVFTTCTTICSPMTAIFSQVQRELAGKGPQGTKLVSISLDPATDTPARLEAYADQFGRKDGWTFLTGKPNEVAKVLRAMGGHVPDKTKHPPLTLVGSGGEWSRILGLVSADRIVRALSAHASAGPPKAKPEDAALAWFTDSEVIDQRGKPHRFYSDLIKDRVVLIHFAFTSCKGACSPIVANLRRVQRLLGDRTPREVRILTLSVDPTNDTPDVLREFASRFDVGPGWYFLTGASENLDRIRRRLGDVSVEPDAHPMTLYIGNAATGNWIRAMATDAPEKIAEAVIHLDDP